MMSKPVRFALLALGPLCLNPLVPSLSAQMFDNPIKVKVWHFVRGQGGSPSPHVSRNFGGAYSFNEFTLNSESMEDGTSESKTLNVGEEYSFTFTARNMAAYEFVFDLPPNMALYLDGKKRSVIGPSDIVGDSFTVKVLPRGQALGFGQSSGLATGKLLWELGVGRLSNGESAGTIMLSRANIDAASYKPSALHYSENFDEVDAVFSNGVLRQVYAPGGLLDIIVIDASEYDIRVYNWAQVEAKSNGLYTATGCPSLTYTIDNPGDSAGKRIRIRKDVGAIAYQTIGKQEADHDWEVKDWHEVSGNPERIIFRDYQSPTDSVVKVTEYGSSDVVTQTDYDYTAGGTELSGKTLGSGPNALKTTYKYFATGGMGQQEKPESATLSCGNEIKYTWYTRANYTTHGQGENAVGQARTMTRPFLDGASDEGDVVAAYTYHLTADRPLVASLVETATINQEIIRDVAYAYNFTTFNNGAGDKAAIEITRTEKYNEDAGATLATLTKVYSYALNDAFLRNQIYSRKNPDGTKTSYLYQRGSWNGSTFKAGSGQYKRITLVHGLAEALSGTTHSVSSINGGTIDTVHCVKKKSTSKALIMDPAGAVIRTRDYVFNNSAGWTKLAEIRNTYQSGTYLVKRERVEGNTLTTLYEASYTNHQLAYAIDEAGTKVTYTYDAAGRVKTRTRKGWNDTDNFFDQVDLVTTYFYDCDGNLTKTEAQGQGNTEKIVTEYQYDKARRRTRMIERGDGSERYHTLYAYQSCGNYLKTTHPDGSAEIRTYFKDGKPKSITGTAVPDRKFSYAILTSSDREGYLSSKVTYEKSHSGSDDQWEETHTDWLGRTARVIRPTHDGGKDAHTDYSYDNDGLLQKIATTSGATTITPNRLYGYDALKALHREAIDTDNDGGIDTGTDRVTEYTYQYEYRAGQNLGWWRYEDAHVYNDYGTGAPKKTKTRYSYTRLSGFSSDLLSETHVGDANSQLIKTKVEVDRAKKRRSVIEDRPEASGTADAQKTYLNGKLAVSKTIEGASNDYVDHKYQYDHLGRLKTHKDPRIGDTTTTYYPGTTQVKVVTAPDGRTTTYDYDVNSGRLIWTKDHTGNYQRTEVSYSGDDRWVHTWGDTANPVKIKYDDLGRRVEMRAYRTGTWTGATKPSGFSASGDKTIWNWDGETGLLDSKTDAAGRTHTFTYNDRGQIKRRTDAKSVASLYAYYETADASSDAFTGELKKIDYPAGTDVQYAYTRFGALKTVTDATGTRTFTYRSDLQVEEEKLGDFYDYGSGADDLKLIYGYASTGVKGRLTDFDLKAGSSYLLQDGYGYESVTGRLNQVTGHGQTFTLSYLANSHLISEVESGSFERHINRQTNSHRISSIENEWSQADRVNFTYSYDALGRISTRTMTGTIKDAYGSNTTELRDTYSYNARHELIAAKTEAKISGTYQELVGRKHAFTYDEQGNRKTHSRNTHTTTYTTNNLNQYTARTNHGFLLVEGTSNNAAVKVYETGSTEVVATRKNDYYFRDWDPDTTSTASDYPEINVKEGTTVTSTGKAWIPAVSETPITYDANGNLTADALWSYAYDEENRLISMTETSAAATAGFPDTTITFKYDYLGRRVEKKVVRGTTTVSHLRFVWRGWMLVAELNAASDNAKVKTYTWGPDVSGSFGGAGGNGGVLVFKDHTSSVNESFYPAYDAQGNVTGLINTSGNLDAAYEYDPYGKLIRYAGARRASMSLLYGTKYTDMETGLIYYGRRYYDPRQGRFINRDPIEEEGGLNQYRFVGNNPGNGLDFLGLYASEVCDEDSDEYDDMNCLEIMESKIYELEEFIVWDDPEIRLFYSGYGSIGDELLADIIGAYDGSDYEVYDDVENGDYSPGKVDESERKKEEYADKELLEKLCATEEGQEFVERLNSEFSIYSSVELFTSENAIGYQLQGTNDIYLNGGLTFGFLKDNQFPGDHSHARDAQVIILYSEVQEYDLLSTYPEQWEREAHARFNSDQFAIRNNLQPWFPGRSLNDHLRQLRPLNPSPFNPDHSTGGYDSRKLSASDFSRLTSDRIAIGGWDCSRLESDK